MLSYLLSILGLAVLCAAWVLFQLWLKRMDPDTAHPEARCGGCGSCQDREPNPVLDDNGRKCGG